MAKKKPSEYHESMKEQIIARLMSLSVATGTREMPATKKVAMVLEVGFALPNQVEGLTSRTREGVGCACVCVC